jgi:arylsulfatase
MTLETTATQILTMQPILTLLASLALACGAAFAADKPHIIFVMADDMGWSDLGCYGGEIATPNLDSLAKNGLRFTQFYNTARCWPTRGALLTGYYAQQIRRDALPGGPGGGQGVRPAWAPLLPDFLRPAGYRSYHSGKWHIDGDVLAGGFDRSLHTKNDGNFFTAKGNFLDDQPVTPAADESGYYVTTATADHAIACLKDHAANHAGKPFFHYVPFIAPHFPLHALPLDIAKYRDRYLAGWEAMREARFRRQKEMAITRTTLSPLERAVGPPYAFPDAMVKLGPGEVNRPLPWSELTEEQRRFQATKMAIHAAMIDRMDQEIGRILAQLKAMNAYDNTLILFASDNGASAEIMVRHGGHDPQAAPGSAATYLCLGPGFSSACNTPHRRHKTWVHEGGISTPLIAHWPQGFSARNELRHTPAHVIDFVPTVLELVGIQKPKEWKGQPIPKAPGNSLAPAFAKDQTIPRESLWWLHEGHRAIRVGDWKLVAAKGDPWELYDLKTDRAEQHNLATEMPDKVKELEAAWQRQTDSFTELAKKTPTDQAQPKADKGKAKGQPRAD